jgi:hypothetical protein
VALRIALLLCLCFVRASVGWSQDQLKKDLFDDCEAAKRAFLELHPEQRQPLLEFFTRVIGLSTQSPSAPEAFAVIPGAPKVPDGALHAGGKPPDVLGALWQTTDAKHELRGKRCALELLQSAGADALEILPTLVKIYSEQPLSDEIAVSLEETSALIAERAHKQGITPSPAQFDVMVPYLMSSRTLVAQNTLQEFLALATPRIVYFLSDRTEAEAKTFIDFLHVVDKDGSRAYRSFIDLVPTLSEPQVRRLSQTLPLPAAVSLSQFIPDLLRLSMTPERTPTFLPLLAKMCVASGGIKTDSSLDSRLAQFSLGASWRELSVEQASCLINSWPPLGRAYVSLFAEHQDPATIEFAINLLSNTQKSLQLDTRLQVATRLRELSVTPTIAIAAQATLALRFFPERRTESLSIAAQNIKRGFDLKDPSQRDLLIEASFGLVRGLGAQRESAKFSASVIRALETNVARPEAELLAAQLLDIESQLGVLLRNQNNAGARAAALRALGNRATISKSTLTSIIELLSQSELQSLAIHALARGGGASTTMLRRTVVRGGDSARHAALSALALSGALSKQELGELLMSIQNQQCSHLEEDIEVLCSGPVAGSSDPADRDKIISILNRCAASLPRAQQEILITCLPSACASAHTGLIAIAKNSPSVETMTPLLTQLVASAPSTERDSMLITLLSEASDPIRERLVELLMGRRDSGTEVRGALRALGTSTTLKSSPLHFAAVRTLASMGDTEFGWRAFLEEGIEYVGRGEYREQILPIVTLLPPDLVLQVVIPNLDGDASERLVGSAIVGAALGTKAVPIVSKVWHLREKRAPAVRYTAILALLQINPLTPDISDYVERVLVNRYYGLAQELPINWPQTVAVVDLDKSRFGTLRTIRLEQLLASVPTH